MKYVTKIALCAALLFAMFLLVCVAGASAAGGSFGGGVPNTEDAFPDNPRESLDDDGDGWSDGIELLAGTGPLDAGDEPADADNDGIPDALEPDQAPAANGTATPAETVTPAWAYLAIAAAALGWLLAAVVVLMRGGSGGKGPEAEEVPEGGGA